MLGAAFVWVWLVLGLRLLSNGGAWHLGWGGAMLVGTVLWPAFALGYQSLKRLAFSSYRDTEDETIRSALEGLTGVPVMFVSFFWSLLVLGLTRFLDSFSKLPHGGVLNLLMSVLALHMLAWGAAGMTHWAWTAWHQKDDE